MQNSQKDLRQKLLGKRGEALACQYLKEHGYKIYKKNYVTKFGEADIIALKEGVYCFVEVKTRESDAFGVPSEAVTREKRRKYRLMAQFFCLSMGKEVPIRYDVASVYDGEIEYFENAFV